MSANCKIVSAPPLLTVQDRGRAGALRYGISASGPMDFAAYESLCAVLKNPSLHVLEFAAGPLEIELDAQNLSFSWAGSGFACEIDGKQVQALTAQKIEGNCIIRLKPIGGGNFGYVAFNADFNLPKVLGSVATNLIANLGGLEGRNIHAGDELRPVSINASSQHSREQSKPNSVSGAPIRFVWGLHAGLFTQQLRNQFCKAEFTLTSAISRMGYRLSDEAKIFADFEALSLVSDPVVAGDIQILGDGTPTVLMRDHQPTGGYPRIGTIISHDLSRFAQMPPRTKVQFQPISIEKVGSLK